jgi:hypothetical protein
MEESPGDDVKTGTSKRAAVATQLFSGSGACWRTRCPR